MGKATIAFGILLTWFCYIPTGICSVAVIKGKLPPVPENSTTKLVVVNSLLDKIEDGYIYTKDGRKFSIPPSVHITDKSKKGAKLKAVTLIFKGNKLISIEIK